jgi:glycosyltransferase involved in cell wall biosynthesis
MAHGIPVVTTPIGAEGIVTATDDAVWIAAPDANFVATTRRALQETDESRRRALRARQIIEQRFSWSAITRMLTSIYEGG